AAARGHAGAALRRQPALHRGSLMPRTRHARALPRAPRRGNGPACARRPAVVPRFPGARARLAHRRGALHGALRARSRSRAPGLRLGAGRGRDRRHARLRARRACAMRSLRSRLILGVAIVTLVPLALSMYLLSRRIEATVRAQAGERLGGALATLEAGLAAD